jgi:TPR repeat protein
MYAQGRGTAKDPVAAYSWITAAALAGDPRGGDLLYSLERSLSAKQKAQAKQQASTLRRSDPQLSATGFAQ